MWDHLSKPLPFPLCGTLTRYSHDGESQRSPKRRLKCRHSPRSKENSPVGSDRHLADRHRAVPDLLPTQGDSLLGSWHRSLMGWSYRGSCANPSASPKAHRPTCQAEFLDSPMAASFIRSVNVGQDDPDTKESTRISFQKMDAGDGAKPPHSSGH